MPHAANGTFLYLCYPNQWGFGLMPAAVAANLTRDTEFSLDGRPARFVPASLGPCIRLAEPRVTAGDHVLTVRVRAPTRFVVSQIVYLQQPALD